MGRPYSDDLRERVVRSVIKGGLSLRRDASSPPLGKLNAVRAAFIAGVTPAKIAREFELLRTEVKMALAREGAK
jgi:transposase-like protein